MTQNEKNAIRESAYAAVEGLDFKGFTYEGQVQEGAVYADGDGNYAVIKVVMKNDGFADEVDDLMEDYQTKEQAKLERAAAKAAKEKAKAEKAAEKADEED